MDPHDSQPRLRSSQLRQPSKIPSPGRGLFDMSASAKNARSMMPPPEPVSLKHKGSALPEPTPKRKTLAERAGESGRLNAGASAMRPVGSAVKGTSLTGARNTSFSSSVSARPPSAASNVSSFSSSIGPGSRPPSAQAGHRPPSAMGQMRPPRQVMATPSRPASAMEETMPESERSASAMGKRKAWDTKGRLEDMEYLYSELKEKMTDTTVERNGLEETLQIYKTRVAELEGMRSQLSSTNTTLQADLDATRARLTAVTRAQDDDHRSHGIELGDLKRQHADEVVSIKRKADDDVDRLRRSHRDELDDLERRLKNEVEETKAQRLREVQTITADTALARQNAELEVDNKARQLRSATADLEQVRRNLDQEKLLNQSLRGNISEASSQSMTLESTVRTLRGRIEFLESDSKSQALSFEQLEQRLRDAEAAAAEAKEKLLREEGLRRKLHNQVQELKGNIRVFCRVRPSLESEPAVEAAKIAYPDSDRDMREVEVLGPEEKSSLGTVSTKKNAFAFDRVFGPSSQNEGVFEEISQLVQSALDGYNVCIFCYGQTGSGKTYTMSSADGMIPRAVRQIYDTAQALEEKGWRYAMEGSFVEVYNENLNDLLGRPEEFDRKKHEIRHDMQRCKTHVSDLTTVDLDSPAKVESILKRATANRSVAATKANERSSRSHSVFMLRLTGENKLTGERSEGTLNLVDLAGSERLSHSGSTGERLKETQNINKSLSCLGDVIGALGQGKEGGHIPYRNSKLTYLLQFSLGGNSKTLMFVMISPLQGHLNETLTSLKFATKVHNTHIGTAKRQAKIRDS